VRNQLEYEEAGVRKAEQGLQVRSQKLSVPRCCEQSVVVQNARARLCDSGSLADCTSACAACVTLPG
jgi:hypothetical protein